MADEKWVVEERDEDNVPLRLSREYSSMSGEIVLEENRMWFGKVVRDGKIKGSLRSGSLSAVKTHLDDVAGLDQAG